MDPVVPFTALVEFLYLRPTRRELEKAIENSRFDALQAQEQKHGFVEMPSSGHFFRKGTSGQWKELLSKNQIQAVVDAHYEQMSRFGYLPQDI